MKPFAWYDHFHNTFYRSAQEAVTASAGGNKITLVYTADQLPDRRFTAAVAAMQALISSEGDRGYDPSELAVQRADRLLRELAK